jgi:glycosyltransferase involved in cell wall biosynthesis
MDRNSFPLVSIITPAYNAMPYLKFNIESVLNQNYPNLEHIIFDGGSKDNSIDILQSYSHLIWISEKDGGQSHALNKGFAIAKGEFIGWLNADDTFNVEAIKKAVKFLINHPEFDMVGTDINIIDENDLVIGRAIGGNTNVIDLLKRNLIKQPSVFMRRSVIETLKGVNENFHYIMDQEFWIRAFMYGFRYKYLPGEFYANFRLIKGTKTFESAPAFNEEWHSYTLSILNDTYFHFLNESEKKNIINNSYMKLYFSKMQLAFIKGEKFNATYYYLKSILSSPSSIFNLSLTKLLILGLVNKKHDIILKFKKNV